MLTSLSVTNFLDELASSSPAPGGGSVSALAASLGTALTSMVCRLTIGKKKYADVQGEMEEVLKQSEELRAQFNAMIDEDTAAFNKVMAAYGLPKETEEQKVKRTAEIQKAMKTATLVPLRLMELCLNALELVKIIVEKGNQNSLSDAGVAALILHAGGEGAALNVKINLGSLSDSSFVAQTKTKVEHYRISLETFTSDILASVNKHLV
ncbi:MAG: cyclodeaminase/cyclohydrolase family protein [Ignavibacteriales bacterium]|nr:cyclodeaminase/cyclohydrolase family protein [Ignavibacteriales bacterium]